MLYTHFIRSESVVETIGYAYDVEAAAVGCPTFYSILIRIQVYLANIF